ncbi:hypothetical protein QQX98_002561 [Neonectria punicea]|uniref:Amino acid permease/ SLC12A domain-containing protein n=1 Tax=Neonectria punicea TaxID=979145 RepID=A0ABR1HID5_9HYPO
MKNLGVGVLPHITNSLLFTSIFSAGHTYVYCASRNLHSLALDGHAPKISLRCTKNGVPIYCFLLTMLFPLLSLLQVSSSTAQVLDWLVNLMTSGGLINFIVICITYLRYYMACKHQNIDRRTLPCYGWFQPYSAWIALTGLGLITLCNGYTVFLPGAFSAAGFLTKYLMVLLTPLTYLWWKFFKGTKVMSPSEGDLVWEKPLIDAYEESMGEECFRSFKVEIMELFSKHKWSKSNVGNGN